MKADLWDFSSGMIRIPDGDAAVKTAGDDPSVRQHCHCALSFPDAEFDWRAGTILIPDQYPAITSS